MTMPEPLLDYVKLLGSLLLGAAGGWLALRDRITRLEHEVWGVNGSNGMKSDLKRAHERIDTAQTREAAEFRRIDDRNWRQHPTGGRNVD